MSESTEKMLNCVATNRIVPVIVMNDPNGAVPLANAILAGGLNIMEITLRTPSALDCIRKIRSEVPEMTIGAGTVLTKEQVNQVKDAGGYFAVAPGINRAVAAEAVRIDLPFIPGIVTASEIEQAIECNCRLLKFFPAEPIGGLPYLKAIAAPYLHLGVKFLPLGSIKQDTMMPYLQYSAVAAIGGSWLAPTTDITAHKWDVITENVRQALDIISNYTTR